MILNNYRSSLPTHVITRFTNYVKDYWEGKCVLVGQVDTRCIINNCEFLACRGIGWHKDFNMTIISHILVLVNDGYVVGAKKGQAEYQDAGSMIILDVNRPHRCKSIDGKTKNKVWMGLTYDAEREMSPDEVDEKFMEVYEKVKS